MGTRTYVFPRAGSRAHSGIITVHFDETEVRFLLYRLYNVNAVVEALTHRIDPLHHKQRWERKLVVERTVSMIRALQQRGFVHVAGSRSLMAEIMIQAIEGNGYFANLPADDARKCAKNIRKADACRLKIQQELSRPVRRFAV